MMKMLKKLPILFLLIIFGTTIYAKDFYNVRDFGAKGDGKMLDTDAINKSIETAAKNGGGTVFFPAGTYLSFSIHLQSNITRTRTT